MVKLSTLYSTFIYHAKGKRFNVMRDEGQAKASRWRYKIRDWSISHSEKDAG
ncbi:MAG TPA: hypothetical protein VGX92_17620 [Pyrinomonadaceae bacterium]|jgi:hypothetical protein|nr:hypothetical protein [Pyrinomonadaceae bacterium]